MTSVPKVSVIIPCYNAWRTLPRALESVMQQRIDSIEVIIVDDGSEPALELPSHLEAPSVRLLRQSNQGAAAARNTGIDAAQGEWIAFLDADDCVHSYTIDRHKSTQNITCCVLLTKLAIETTAQSS